MTVGVAVCVEEFADEATATAPPASKPEPEARTTARTALRRTRASRLGSGFGLEPRSGVRCADGRGSEQQRAEDAGRQERTGELDPGSSSGGEVGWRTQPGCTTAAHASIEYATVVTLQVPGERISWVLLSYRLPREPSTPRITLWRKLKRLGVVQLLDGLVALPADARTREQLEWLADEVVEAGGEASIWIGELGSAAQERELARADGGRGRGGLPAVDRRRRTLRATSRGARAAHARPASPRAARGSARATTSRRPSEQAPSRRSRLWRRSSGGGGVRWATRRHCHVDRAACAWLIRRFIDPEAEFVFVDDPDEVPADATAVRHARRRALPPRRRLLVRGVPAPLRARRPGAVASRGSSTRPTSRTSATTRPRPPAST